MSQRAYELDFRRNKLVVIFREHHKSMHPHVYRITHIKPMCCATSEAEKFGTSRKKALDDCRKFFSVNANCYRQSVSRKYYYAQSLLSKGQIMTQNWGEYWESALPVWSTNNSGKMYSSWIHKILNSVLCSFSSLFDLSVNSFPIAKSITFHITLQNHKKFPPHFFVYTQCM
jgi:hypothetical protein